MDTHAARQARRKALKEDLREAYDDDEATPPEWLDLATAVTERAQKIRARITAETDAFVTEPDIRRAIARRERATTDLREQIVQMNRMVSRLNLIAPLPRFTKSPLDPDEALRPLFRTARAQPG